MLDSERQYLTEYHSRGTPDIKVVIDSRANKTLSQINEEYDEDDLSQFGVKNRRSVASTSPNSTKTVVSQLGRSELQRTPQLAQQIEQMEAEFKLFLDEVYN